MENIGENILEFRFERGAGKHFEFQFERGAENHFEFRFERGTYLANSTGGIVINLITSSASVPVLRISIGLGRTTIGVSIIRSPSIFGGGDVFKIFFFCNSGVHLSSSLPLNTESPAYTCQNRFSHRNCHTKFLKILHKMPTLTPKPHGYSRKYRKKLLRKGKRSTTKYAALFIVVGIFMLSAGSTMFLFNSSRFDDDASATTTTWSEVTDPETGGVYFWNQVRVRQHGDVLESLSRFVSSTEPPAPKRDDDTSCRILIKKILLFQTRACTEAQSYTCRFTRTDELHPCRQRNRHLLLQSP